MNATASSRTIAREQSRSWALPLLLLGGLVLRLIFIRATGFSTDVQTFEAWALQLADHGLAHFYDTSGFADYPPGYFYVLAVIGWFWEAVFRSHDAGYGVLAVLVKLPAIFADLGAGALLYAIAKRFAGPVWAIVTAACYVLNPAVVFNSAYWGQVDSVSAGLALLAIYLLLRSEDVEGGVGSFWILAGWLAFAGSLMIKPQAAVIAPLMIAYAFIDPARMRARAIATLYGVVAAFVFATALAEPFHPGNPFATIVWLFQRYEFGSSRYPYNSVNAFNLWAIRGSFWQKDDFYILFAPQVLWGIALTVAAVALIVWRFVQERSSRALLEGCAVASLAFFVLATRMHERYVFDGLLFTLACIPFARRYIIASAVLTVVLFANLVYSLQYLAVMTQHTAGVDSTNLWGIWTTGYSLLAVATFFYLGYQFLGTAAEPIQELSGFDAAATQAADTPVPDRIIGWGGARNWFAPRQGIVSMTGLDYAIAGVLGLGNFVLSFIGYWWPPDKVFDEIYFARAAEEYLQNMRIYENTHPPFSKLLVTLSVMLFGGMPHGQGLGGWTGLNAIIGHMPNGDNSYGWRFLDVVFGALVVMLLYAFAKRVTSSTLFATIAALLLTFDGMHFVQSRIATPEGFVVFFATLAVYAFYRFWISSQAGKRQHVVVPQWCFAAGAIGSLAVGTAIALLLRAGFAFDGITTTLVAIYASCGLYLIARYLVFPRFFGDEFQELTYAEGSYALVDTRGGTTVKTVDGGSIDAAGKIARGALSQNQGGKLLYRDGDLRIEYQRGGTVRYETPEGDATYSGDEVRAEGFVERGSSSKLWLILFTVALGLLVSSKWYGVMGFGVSFLVLIFVFSQRAWLQRRAAQWGNPRGFRLDGALVTILFVATTVYTLVWMPDLLRHSPDPGEIHSMNDVVERQYTMFEYHDTLKATHPYSSQWWEWPLDYVPVAYFYQDHRKDTTDNNGCCIYEITSMPNPLVLWFGLLCVPLVGYLAWRERNKGYALIVLTYLMQWLPWARTPRLVFAYHFYVDIPLICLCNAIVLQRVWQWARRNETPGSRPLGYATVGCYVAAVAVAFVFFYPILAAHPITWNEWNARMWFKTWIIGPG